MASLLGTAGLFVAAEPASADSGGQSNQTVADGIASRINYVEPGSAGTTRTSIERRLGHIGAVIEGLSISIPNNNIGKIVLKWSDSEKDSHLSVGLPSEGSAKNAAIARNGTVTYQNSLKATDLAVQAFQDSVRVVTVIQGEQAPSEFVYPVDIPAGGNMRIEQDGGVLIVDAEGLPRGGFAAPWAKDSLGREVNTHYEIRDNKVAQVVSHHGATYPVVADPWIWKDLIKKATWVHKGPGFTLEVTPTAWARKWAGDSDVGAAGWNELYSKYKNKGRGIKKNKAGMRNQYICHQQFVAVRNPGKKTWNLDEWRPDVGYAKTVAARCNPGAGEHSEDKLK